MKKLLLTGFVPFLQFPINPTEEIVKALDGKVIGEYEIVSRVLPVDFEQSGRQILTYFDEVQPDAVISIGLAGGRSKITPERIAINVRDGEPDNNGVRLEDAPIAEEGPAGYFSTLPIRTMVNALNEAGLPATISNTAGTYLCNNVMYAVQHRLATEGVEMPAGFIHIPASHELALQQPTIPSWSQADLQRAIEVCIGVL